MSLLAVCAVGAAIAAGFYLINREAAEKRVGGLSKLRDSTAMVFVLSTAVMLLARYLGLGDADGVGEVGGSSGDRGRGAGKKVGGGGGGADTLHPYRYIHDGPPPF